MPIVKANVLRKAMLLASRVAHQKTTMPVLSSVRLHYLDHLLHLEAYDLDNRIIVQIPAADGSARLSPGLAQPGPLTRLLAAMPGKTQGETMVEVSGGNEPPAGSTRREIIFKIEGPNAAQRARVFRSLCPLNVDQWPPQDKREAVPHSSGERCPWEVAYPPKAFLAMLDYIEPAISRDESRYVLSGACVQPNGTWVSTDGHRLHADATLPAPRTKAPAGSTGSELRPIFSHSALLLIREAIKFVRSLEPKALDEIKLYANPGVSFARVMVTGDTVQVEIRCRLIDGAFPEYEQVCPRDNPIKLSTDGAGLVVTLAAMAAVKRGGFVTDAVFEYTTSLGTVIGDPERGALLHAVSHDPELGEIRDTIPCTVLAQPAVGSKPMRFGFNVRYLAQACKSYNGTGVQLELPADEGGPVKIIPSIGRFAVVMPCRLSDEDHRLASRRTVAGSIAKAAVGLRR